MSKIINISDKLSMEKPQIQIDDKLYTVNNEMNTVFKFEEFAAKSSKEAMHEAVKIALGEKAAKEIAIEKMSIPNFKVLFTAIMAAMQDLSYEEAAARFQKKIESK